MDPDVKLEALLGERVRRAAGDVVLLEHEHLPPDLGEYRRRAEPAEARPDDHGVDALGVDRLHKPELLVRMRSR